MALPSSLARRFSIARQEFRNHCFTGSLPLFSRKLPGASNYGRSVASLAINGEKSTSSEDANNPTASDDAGTAEGEGGSEQTLSGDGGSASATGASGASEPESVGSSEGDKGVVKKPKRRFIPFMLLPSTY